MECGSTEIKEESDDEHGNNTDNIPTRTFVTYSNSNFTIRGEPEEFLDIKIEPEESESFYWSHINVEHNYSKIVVIKDESNLLEMKGEVDDIILASSDPTSSDPASSDPTSSDPTSSDPASSDPTSSDPTSSDPASSDPTSSDPTSSDPTSSDQSSSGLNIGLAILTSYGE